MKYVHIEISVMCLEILVLLCCIIITVVRS